MAKAFLGNVLKRIKEIQAELTRLEDMILYSQEIERNSSSKTANTRIADAKNKKSRGSASKKRGFPAIIADAAESVIIKKGRPMTRGEIALALINQGFDLPPTDPAKYVGTILWRMDDKFENREGEGYWIKGRRLKKDAT